MPRKRVETDKRTNAPTTHSKKSRVYIESLVLKGSPVTNDFEVYLIVDVVKGSKAISLALLIACVRNR
jgi:hypothetical protein